MQAQIQYAYVLQNAVVGEPEGLVDVILLDQVLEVTAEVSNDQELEPERIPTVPVESL